MIKPHLPLDEHDRLQTLLEYEVLDSPEEENFDDLVKMASEICATPIALISLLDDQRQWFKASAGLGVKETPRDISFCGHAIHQEDVFIVPDSKLDARFNDNPLVTGDPQIGFYAGAPLIAPNGKAIGTLCVIDHRPRELSETQLRHLRILSRQVMAQLEIRKSIKKMGENFIELQSLSKKVLEQQELIKAREKLAVIGELASGVSHEINNPLAIISGSVLIVSTMLEKGEGKDIIRPQLDRIDVTVRRLSKIGKALSSISGDKGEGFKDAQSVKERFLELMKEAKATL
jgi:two-component system, NtrC family, sensor kinase